MKKLLIAGLIGLTAFSAQAQGHHGFRGGHHHHHHRHGGWNWVVPAVIGGAVVYAATRPPVVVQQPPVVVQPVPNYQAPIGYRWEAVLDANCNCYRNVLVPIN